MGHLKSVLDNSSILITVKLYLFVLSENEDKELGKTMEKNPREFTEIMVMFSAINVLVNA